MLVVSDATPLNILVRAELVPVLPELFTHVLIPPAVLAELTHERTPAVVREWIQSRPAWLGVRAPVAEVGITPKGLGERQAIALAIEVRADFLLSDDREARDAAAQSGLQIIGTLGTLKAAADRGLVELASAIDRVRVQGLFLTSKLIEETIREHERGRER